MARIYLYLLLCVAPMYVFAAVTQEMHQKIEQRLHQFFPDLQIDAIEDAPLKGFYQVIASSEIYYVSDNLQHVFFGEILDLNQSEATWNVTERRRQQARMGKITSLPKNSIVTYSAEKPKTGIYIFTDVDCIYCRRIHQHVAELNAAGIDVNYLAFPRQGLNSKSFHTMVSVWCAENPQEMLTLAKHGKEVPTKTCEHSVDKHYKLGLELGIRGTPTIVFADGSMTFGYIPVKQLISAALEHAQR